MLELINHVQPTLPWSPAHFDWQLTQGPAGAAAIRVIESDGKIVSLYVGTRKRLWLDGESRAAVMVQDVLTHLEYRGRGFLNALAGSFLEEIRSQGLIGYTFPNKLSENSFRRSGWTELCRIPILRMIPAPGLPGKRPALFQATESFADDIGAVWREAGLTVGVLRDAAYLSWRYARPDVTYWRFRIEGNAGYLVLKPYRSDAGDILHICDLVLREEARVGLPSVLAEVSAIAGERGMGLVTAWVPAGHPYRPAYEAAGFTPDRGNDRFAFVTGPAGATACLQQESAWHLSHGDSDVY